MTEKTTKLLATFFHIGNVPFAPGTAGSFAGLLIYMLLQNSLVLYIPVFFVITGVGLMVSEEAERLYKTKDPSQVVIDEVAGMLLACFMLPLDVVILTGAFLLFRFFDILKVYPMRRLEKIRGGIGIMADDLLAGLYTNIVVHVAVRWSGIL